MNNLPGPPSRISLTSIAQDVMHVLNLDRGFGYTIWGALVRPRVIVEEYLYTDRKRGAHPLRLLLFTSALSALITFYSLAPSIQTDFNDGVREGIEMEGDETTTDSAKGPINITLSQSDTDIEGELTQSEKLEKAEQVSQAVQDNLQAFMNAFALLSVPVYALITWLLFKKRRWNYAEHLVAHSFLMSILNVISILFGLLALVWPSIMIVMGVLGIIYALYAFGKTFSSGGWRGYLRAGMAYSLCMLVSSTIGISVVAWWVVTYVV